MSIKLTGSVGPDVLGDGAESEVRLGRGGELVVVEGHGRYYEPAFRSGGAGNTGLFTAYAPAGAVSLPATAYTGLALYNPISNTKNAVLQKIAGMIIVTSSTTTGLVLAQLNNNNQTAPASVTAITPICNKFGAAAPSCAVYSAATLAAAPAPFWPLMHNTAAIATSGEDPGFEEDFEGSVIVPPGFLVAVCALGAASAAASTVLALSWEEVPT